MLISKLAEFSEKFDMLPKGSLVLAAVSGGRDSMCLLDALLTLAPKGGFSVAAAHFNHCLRGAESDGDEEFVREYCASRGVACYIGRGDVKAEVENSGGGTEEVARRLRYAFLENAASSAGASRIATAHNADDNVETVLLNIARGSGLKGICGIPPVRDRFVRPLLTVSRAEIDEYVKENSIPYRDDSTNSGDEYARNRIRHGVTPILSEINPSLCENVAAMTSLLREDEAFLDGLARKFIDENLHGRRMSAEKLLGEPRPVAARIIKIMCPASIDSRHVDAALRLCASDSPSAIADLPGIRLRREYGDVVFGDDAPELDFPEMELTVGSSVRIEELRLEISCEKEVFNPNIYNSFTTFLFKNEAVCGKMVIRPRKSGDTIRLSERGGTKTLKKLFIEKRIPAAIRQHVPVIADDNGVAAVFGIGADIRFKPKPGDAVLKVTVKDMNKNE